MMLENITLGFTALAAGGAVWAAWEARKSAEAAKNASEAALVAELLEDDFTDEMSEALRTLRAWQEDNGGDFANIWIKRLQEGDELAKNVEQARRLTKRYFVKISRLCEYGLARGKTIRAAGYVAGINIYYDIVDPLELALNPGRRADIIDNLRQAVGRYEEASEIKSVRPRNPQ